MSMHRFSLSAVEECEDEFLARADDEVAREAALLRPMGQRDTGAITDAPSPGGPNTAPAECPFDMGVAQPRALSLLRLYALQLQKVPPDIQATLGRARLPVLIVHQMTPFSRFGRPPTRVWGMGYRVQNLPSKLVPVDFAPRGEFFEIANWSTNLNLSFSAAGKFELDESVSELVNAIPGVNVEGLSYGIGADNQFRLAFGLKLYVLKLIAGLVGRGVRWDFIEQDERLDRPVTMLQTVLLPRGMKKIDMDVEVWVGRRTFLGIGSRRWSIAPQRMTVDVEA